jgi:hypothetical protein
VAEGQEPREPGREAAGGWDFLTCAVRLPPLSARLDARELISINRVTRRRAFCGALFILAVVVVIAVLIYVSSILDGDPWWR